MASRAISRRNPSSPSALARLAVSPSTTFAEESTCSCAADNSASRLVRATVVCLAQVVRWSNTPTNSRIAMSRHGTSGAIGQPRVPSTGIRS